MSELMDTTAFTSGPPVSVPVEYNTRDLILYSLGIGSKDSRFTFELDDNFAAFPTYPIVLTFKGNSFDVLSFPSPAMMAVGNAPLKGVRVGLDAEKTIEKVAEIPKDGAKLTLKGRVVGVHKKGSGALVEKEFELVDEAGKVYYRIVDGSFMVGAKGFADSGKTYSETIKTPPGPATITVEEVTNPDICRLYRLSGDYNPLHVDPNFATMAGFPSPIIHGQCNMGHATRIVLDACAGGDQKRFKRVQMRFAAPMLPGQTLVTEMWKVSPTEVIFQSTVKETGKVCLSNARMTLHPEAKL
uniref:MaoC-like domain-containing protein n=1 Tax=Noctiluca scintillans TaxID=2966 RepID=A0A7S1ASN2_NOCSC